MPLRKMSASSPPSPSPTALDYAYRLSPPAAQPALAALRAWWQEVASLPHAVSDPAIAAAKLGWWRRELQAGWAGTPQHPLLQALQRVALDLDAAPLLRTIEAAEEQARQTRFLDEPALLRWAADQGAILGAAGQIIARSSGRASLAPELSAACADLGQACVLAASIRAFGRAAQSGRLLVPVSDLQQAGLKAHEALGRAPALEQDARYQAVMATQAARARRHLQRSLAAVQRAAPRRLTRGLRVLGALHLALLAELQRTGYPVLQQHVMLTPVRRAWIAATTW